jgi:hypothetical protein
MRRTIYDFDVVTGPVEPRPAPKPVPKPHGGQTEETKPAGAGK